MLDTTRSLADQCTQIWDLTRKQRREEERTKQEPALLRLWDAEWELQHIITGIEYEASFTWVSNDVGPGMLEIPFEHPAAQWIHDSDGRVDRGEGRGVHITVDYCKARWSGRMEKSSVETREDGSTVMVLTFAHDYLELSYITCWSNPYLPSSIQAPRSWVLGGPVDWILLTTLHANLFRLHNPLLTVPDDPLDFDSWDSPLDQSDWPMVTKPLKFGQAMRSGVMWGLISSRWQTWSDMAKIMLDDSELSVTCTRYLDGDELPWADAELRHGCLVIGIEDKSGVHVGTANGGNIFDGIRRTIASFGEDFIESTSELITDTEMPDEYFIPGKRLTHKEFPYVVYRTGEGSGIETSKFIHSPAKAVTIQMGGKSMPGVVCAPSRKGRGAGDLAPSMKLFQPRSALSGTSSGTCSSSARWVEPSTICSSPSTAMSSGRGCRGSCSNAHKTRAGHATKNISKTWAAHHQRHTPSPA